MMDLVSCHKSLGLSNVQAIDSIYEAPAEYTELYRRLNSISISM